MQIRTETRPSPGPIGRRKPPRTRPPPALGAAPAAPPRSPTAKPCHKKRNAAPKASHSARLDCCQCRVSAANSNATTSTVKGQSRPRPIAASTKAEAAVLVHTDANLYQGLLVAGKGYQRERAKRASQATPARSDVRINRTGISCVSDPVSASHRCSRRVHSSDAP